MDRHPRTHEQLLFPPVRSVASATKLTTTEQHCSENNGDRKNEHFHNSVFI